MPYWLKFSSYPFGVESMAFTIAGMLKPFGRGVNRLFAIVAPYLIIIIGRRVLGRKNL